MLTIIKPPNFLRKFYPKAIWKIPTKEKVVFLTFDDGPIPDVTEKVLDLLDLYHAKATFFCIGDNVLKYDNIYKRILAEGHAVGNHTFNHLKGSVTDNSAYFSNIEQCSQIVSSNLFRPPYGRLKKTQYRYLIKNYNVVFWDVLSWDFKPEICKEQCAKNVINNTNAGSVVVFHDSLKAKKNCLFALEKTLEHFSQQGYQFKALNQYIK